MAELTRLEAVVVGLLSERPAHGYELKARLGPGLPREAQLNDGVLYPLLARLERRGLASSSEERSGGRRRRVYAATAGGDAAFREWLLSDRDEDAVVGYGALRRAPAGEAPVRVPAGPGPARREDRVAARRRRGATRGARRRPAARSRSTFGPDRSGAAGGRPGPRGGADRPARGAAAGARFRRLTSWRTDAGLLTPRSGPAHGAARVGRRLRGLPADRRRLAPPADLPELRARRLLRQLAEPARDALTPPRAGTR